jgi:hypothetical protein
MSEHSRTVEFGGNHRRVISVLMRGTARACDEVLEWLERRSTALAEVRDDLTAQQHARLRRLAAELKGQVVEFSRRTALDKQESSVRRSIAAIVSAALVDLEEVQNSSLRGYGPLTHHQKQVLEEHLEGMAKVLEEMLQIAEAG